MKSSFSSTPGSSRKSFLNILTLGILVIGFILLILVLSIFVNPLSPLNPFPPPAFPPTVEIPTATATLRNLPSIWTPTSWEISGIGEPYSAVDTPLPFATPKGGYPFGLQGSSTAVSSSSFHSGTSCSWMGVGGRVYDLANTPLKGLVLRLGGNINGVELEEKIRLSGMDTIFGPSGFEFTLSNTPLHTVHAYWIRLEDQAGNPLSDTIYFDTFAECKSNLILINFKELH